jgi:membrane protease YdiL (CAAX protease family)
MHEASSLAQPESIAIARGFIALLLASMPFFAYLLIPYTRHLDIATVLVATSALICLLYRRSLGLHYVKVKSFSKSLSLTHTAFALGCIPAALMFALYPSSFEVFTRNEIVAPTASSSGTASIQWGGFVMFALKVSVWAGLTEELIFRFTLVSILRRIRIFKAQIHRDLFAVFFSAILFGIGHVALWGPFSAIALTGIGVGFGVAYIATREELLPVVVYHIAFDFISILISVWIGRL